MAKWQLAFSEAAVANTARCTFFVAHSTFNESKTSEYHFLPQKRSAVGYFSLAERMQIGNVIGPLAFTFCLCCNALLNASLL